MTFLQITCAISVHPSDFAQGKEYAVFGVGSYERVIIDPRFGVDVDGVARPSPITNWKARSCLGVSCAVVFYHLI